MSNTDERVLTTGEVASYCGVHLRTVIRWIEKGQLKAYRLPGQGNNRIEEKDFLAFLTQNKMPIPSDLLKNKNDKTRKVLVVDDNVDMAKSIKGMLELAGYEAYMAHDGFQAGVQLGQIKPQLMILELAMSNVDSFAILEFLRNQSSFNALKILIVSVQGAGELERACAIGAHDYLAKPFQEKTLVSVVDALCS